MIYLRQKIIFGKFRGFSCYFLLFLECTRFAKFIVIFLNVLSLTLFLRRFFRRSKSETAGAPRYFRKKVWGVLEVGEEERSIKKVVVADQGSCSLVISGTYPFSQTINRRF